MSCPPLCHDSGGSIGCSVGMWGLLMVRSKVGAWVGAWVSGAGAVTMGVIAVGVGAGMDVEEGVGEGGV